VYKFVTRDDGRDVIFEKWFNRDKVSQYELVSVNNIIDITTPVIDTSPLSTFPINQNENHNLGDVDGQDTPIDSCWKQVKSYAALVMEHYENGVDAVKQFFSTLTSEERSYVMVVFEEAQPVMFEQLVA
jgi:hypothetical protein